MQQTTQSFRENVANALKDKSLARAMGVLKTGFAVKRAAAIVRLPEFDALRDRAKDMKDHVLAHLDFYLERFEEKVLAQGGHVHWCQTAQDARETILKICREAGASTVTKGKSMIAEEIGLNDFLEARGVNPIETDLGEYIIQLRREPPSHIIAPAIHLNRGHVAEAFRKAHADFPENRLLEEPRALLNEARAVLRRQFLKADVGITGANFLIAETGSTVIVTNEGNGDLTQILPRVHIVLASLEKLVPTLEDASLLLRLLARSATGQEITSYVTFSTGPKRAQDLDGPEAFHVVLLDNGRSAMLGTDFQDMLRCIRCAACINHCPVYAAIGGHAYGSVYPGPMGSVLTPSLYGLAGAENLPHASTLCGRCESVCPMLIPLPKMLRLWRTRAWLQKSPILRSTRWALTIWGFLAARPKLYHMLMRLGVGVLGRLGRRRGRFSRLPLAAGWTKARDFPAPQGRSFSDLWRARANGQK